MAATKPLVGDVAIVTGASSGIGAAIAIELARRGATVVLAARREANLRDLAERIRDEGGTALAIPADLSQSASAQALARRVLTQCGRVDVLVNNAGVAWHRRFSESSQEESAGVLQVDLLAAIGLTREVLPGMIRQRHGAIISVGSLSGRVAMEPLYSAAKYGLRGFSLALRRQLAGSGVSASLVSPGKIRTPMTADDIGRLPPPELVAGVVADLVRRPRREVVVPRRHYAIAWLEQACPGAADLAFRWRNWSPVRDGDTRTQVAGERTP